jgi:hypothetical protein
MTDPLEQRVRESLERRAERAGGPLPAAPEGLHRRVRGRQSGVLLATLATVGALVAGSVIGLEQLDRSSATLGGDAESTSTGTAGGVTITYPTDWYFEPLDAGPFGAGASLPSSHSVYIPLGGNVSLFALSNYTPSEPFSLLPDAQACTPTAALLAVREEFGVAPGGGTGAEMWPVRLTPPSIAPMPPGCASALVATWSIGRGDVTFHASAFFGPDVSRADRTALIAAFESMSFAPASEATGYPSPTISPGVVQAEMELASGRAAGVPWSLRASRGGADTHLILRFSGASLEASGFDTSGRPLELLAHTFGDAGTSETVVFGAVAREVDSVVPPGFTGDASDAARILSLEAIGAPFDAFVVQLGGAAGSLEAKYGDGKIRVRFRFAGDQPQQPSASGPTEVCTEGPSGGTCSGVAVPGATPPPSPSGGVYGRTTP